MTEVVPPCSAPLGYVLAEVFLIAVGYFAVAAVAAFGVWWRMTGTRS